MDDVNYYEEWLGPRDVQEREQLEKGLEEETNPGCHSG